MDSIPAAERRSPTGLPPGLPSDWRFPHDLSCPTCNYNLRGLGRPQCTECGLEFRWQQLTLMTCPRCAYSLAESDLAVCPDCGLGLEWGKLFELWKPAAVAHFEYTKKPRRRFISLLFRLLLPFRFWSKTPLEMPPAVSRLAGLRLFSLTLFLISAGVCGVVMNNRSAPWMGSIADAKPFAICSAVPPLVSLFAIPLFAPTLARFRIRRDRLIRVSAYLSGLLVWLALGWVVTVAAVESSAIMQRLLLPWLAPTSIRLPNGMVYVPSAGPGSPNWAITLLPPELELVPEYVFRSVNWSSPPLKFFNEMVAFGVLAFLAFWIVHLYVILRVYLRLDAPNIRAILLSVVVIAFLATILGLSFDERALILMARPFINAPDGF